MFNFSRCCFLPGKWPGACLPVPACLCRELQKGCVRKECKLVPDHTYVLGLHRFPATEAVKITIAASLTAVVQSKNCRDMRISTRLVQLEPTAWEFPPWRSFDFRGQSSDPLLCWERLGAMIRRKGMSSRLRRLHTQDGWGRLGREPGAI